MKKHLSQEIKNWSGSIPYLTDTLTVNALKQSIREACENHEITFKTRQFTGKRQKIK